MTGTNENTLETVSDEEKIVQEERVSAKETMWRQAQMLKLKKIVTDKEVEHVSEDELKTYKHLKAILIETFLQEDDDDIIISS